jgi:hypothetical protein
MTAGNPQGDGSDAVAVGRGGVKRKRNGRERRGLYEERPPPRLNRARPTPQRTTGAPDPSDSDEHDRAPPAPRRAGPSPNPMDPDEHDCGPTRPPRVAAPRSSRQARRSKGSKGIDSSSNTRNDAGSAHQALHVENDIADLGAFMSLMQPQDVAREHDFGHTLEEYAANGVPVDCGEDWTCEQIRTAVEKGPHQSARTPEAVQLFKEDIEYQVSAGFARIIEWDAIKANPPNGLKVSPVAAVPQANRRPRIILDLSFPVRVGAEIVRQAVNESTVDGAHQSALRHLGSTMPRIAEFMAHAPSAHPIYWSKYDVSDGFWRMVVAPGAEWNFAYVLPQEEGQPTRLVVPSALQMGWKESPAFFCSASETARDVAAKLAGFNGAMHDLPMHKFEGLIKRPSPADAPQPSTQDAATPWAAVEVFVDDFIAMSQDVGRIPHLTRSILHGIEEVFPGPDTTGHAGGREPVSEKKIRRGEADWTTRKVVLGWLLDGERRTIELTDDKAAAYTEELRKLLRRSRIPMARYRKIIGRLRFASFCVPAGKALMTPLNMAMRGSPAHVPSGRKSEVHESLGDWLQLVKGLKARPTSVRELVATSVDYYGYCDACNTGAGGVWLPLDSALEPIVWRVAWPEDIVRRLATYDNLSISDAESAGVLLQQMALEVAVANLRHKTAVSFCDNTPAVSWVTRLASRQSRVGGRLVKGLATRARAREMGLPQALSVQGVQNEMADVASRSFCAASGFVLSNASLLTHFDAHFPLPQNRSWKTVTLPQRDISKVFSTLRGERLTMAQWTSHGEERSGRTGSDSVACGESPQPSQSAASSSKPRCSELLLSGSGGATTDTAVASLRNQLTRQSAPLARPSSWLDTEIQPRSMADASALFSSAASSKRIAAKTRHRSPSSPSRSA